MPDCLNCGTWNPDDKIVCWRCQAELPKPVTKKTRQPLRILGLPIWIWLALIFFLILMLVSRIFISGAPAGG
jgi:hypothetical protein